MKRTLGRLNREYVAGRIVYARIIDVSAQGNIIAALEYSQICISADRVQNPESVVVGMSYCVGARKV